MTAKAFSRGHEIYFIDNEWYYADNGQPIQQEERPCKRCGKMPTPEGHDACLGHIKNAISACCGHGAEKPYCIKDAGNRWNEVVLEAMEH